MIATIHGTIEALADDALVVNVNGVGFRVRVPSRTLTDLGAIGSQVQLFTHLRVREDELSLYGFASADELQLFELLLTVSGVGPKVALALVSSAPVNTLRMAIASGNVDALTAIPGVGKKTAQRLALELKGKIDVTGFEAFETAPVDEDVVSALITLGYSAAEATRAARAVPSDAKTVEERVRVALQYLGGR